MLHICTQKRSYIESLPFYRLLMLNGYNRQMKLSNQIHHGNRAPIHALLNKYYPRTIPPNIYYYLHTVVSNDSTYPIVHSMYHTHVIPSVHYYACNAIHIQCYISSNIRYIPSKPRKTVDVLQKLQVMLVLYKSQTINAILMLTQSGLA